MKALLLKAVEALKQGLRIEELGRREDVHWESLRDMRRAFHDQQLAAIADLEAAIKEQPGGPAIDADAIAGLRRYLNDVLAEGSATERVIAQTVSRMIAKPPVSAVAPLKDEGEARPGSPPDDMACIQSVTTHCTYPRCGCGKLDGSPCEFKPPAIAATSGKAQP